MIKSIHHTAISVRDMKRSLDFYRDILGMTVEWALDPYPSNLELSKVVFLKNLQVRIAMLSGSDTESNSSNITNEKGNHFREMSAYVIVELRISHWK